MSSHTSGPKAVAVNAADLNRLPSGIPVPRYDRSRLVHSIVHVGVGGFFRAHQAVYLDDLITKSGSSEWGICGVGLLKKDRRMYDAMRNQDCLYTVVERSVAGDKARVVGSMTGFLFAPDDREAVLEKMASPDCRILTMTITEGGYYINSGTGSFDVEHTDIRHDLADPTHPVCVFGYLAEALRRRKARGLAPFSLMSCDNIQSNGDVLRKMLLAFLDVRDEDLGAWLAEKGAFPNSMVDRITPATTDEHRVMVRDTFAIDDAWPVVTEPFRQWVIEDHFCNGRPRWEDVGAQMTSNVLPYEKLKLRLLNASHQALCYIGILLGYDFVHQAMEDARIRKLVRAMMDQEVTPLLSAVPGVDPEEYKGTLIERFSNPTIQDRLLRISSGGSDGIPKFVLPSVNDQLARGGPVRMAAFTVAAWFRFLAGVTDAGKKFPVTDAMAPRVCALAKRGGADPRAMLSLHEIFGDLDKSSIFVAEVERALRSFYDRGAIATLESYTHEVK